MIIKTSKLLKEFLDSSKSSGLVLIICTVVSLCVANSNIGASYQQFFRMNLLGHSIEHWVNDGLMTIFFLLIGLELERETYIGQLSKLQDALLPLIAAIGGVIVPVIIFLIFNINTQTQSGLGIPMATDIAFALGALSLLGNRVPIGLKVFLTALAVIDDLIAILVIAIFYTKTLFWGQLCLALAIFLVLLIFNRLKIRNVFPYLIGGVFMWYFMLHSGVHATITGVLLAFAIPFSKGEKSSISYALQHFLHKPVAFIILPVFAFVNTAIFIPSDIGKVLTQKYSLGIGLGLLIGKPLGVFLTSFLAVKIKICELPENFNWNKMFYIGCLAGMGFTMSIFITLLAFDEGKIIDNSKFVVLLASLFAGSLGLLGLSYAFKKETSKN